MYMVDLFVVVFVCPCLLNVASTCKYCVLLVHTCIRGLRSSSILVGLLHVLYYRGWLLT